MSQHDHTGHATVPYQGTPPERRDGAPGEARPRRQIPHHGPVQADVLADMETFIQAPPMQYPSFDIEKFLRELPAVMPQNVPAVPEDVCLICVVKYNREDPESFLTERPCRLPCGHVIGRACVAKWLRPHPEGSNANSCPTCRHRFFAAWPAVPPPAARDAFIAAAPIPIHANNRWTARDRGRDVQNPPARNANVFAAPLPPNANHRRVARNGDRRPQRHLLDHEVYEGEARMREILRRTGQPSVDIRGLRPARATGRETNRPPARLVRFIQQIQQMHQQGINLRGPELPGNPGQGVDDWNAQFEAFMQQMQEQGILNSPRSEPSGDAGQDADGHGNQATDFHIRIVQAAGFRTLPDMSPPSTAREHEDILGRRASNRRQVALRELALYTSLIARGARLPRPENPMDELLDHRQDQALFEWLQNHSAFSGLAFNETYRCLQAGRIRTNREIYDMLRDCGVFWEMVDNRNGRWRTRERYLFDDEEEELSDTFQELVLEGLLDDPDIRGLLGAGNHYAIFRSLSEIRATWDSLQRMWQLHSSHFADGESHGAGMRGAWTNASL